MPMTYSSVRHYNNVTFPKPSAVILVLFLLQPFFGGAFQQSSVTSLHPSTTAVLWSTAISATADATATTTTTTTDITDITDEEPISIYAASHWDDQFEELQSFKAECGHCNFPQNPPATLEKKYPTLASFCRVQRSEYKKNKLRTNNQRMTLQSFDWNIRCRQLEELGFEFNMKLANWYDNYYELLQYRHDNGHTHVSQMENPSLYNWIFSHERRHDRLSEKQLKLLNDIGITWKPDDTETKWHARYNELVEFKNKHGHLLVDAGGPLDRWMHHQRRLRRGRRQNRRGLTDEKRRLLDKIDFPWNPVRLDVLWLNQYNEIVRFQEHHGHCRPGRRTYSKEYSWLQVQRNKRESGLLGEEQIKLLEKIGLSWEGTNANVWIPMHKKLVEYCNEHGNLQVSEDDDPELYDWMTFQRKRYHGIVNQPPKMTEQQIEKMEEIHFCWSLDWKERVWHEKYTEVVEFYKDHGHVQVKKKDNASVFNWIKIQGERYKETEGYKSLSEEELELLEQIEFAFLKDRPRVYWNSMYAELHRYHNENDGRFPSHQEDPKLSRWMRQQRNRLRSTFGYVALSEEQKSMLESMGCPMVPKTRSLKAWYAKYDELVEFWKRHGHFLVGQADNPILFEWVGKQRSKYKGGAIRSERLSRSQIYLLERIDFPWVSNRYELEWQARYDELVEFLEAEGRFPGSLSEHPKLYKWTFRQRQRYKGTGDSDITDHQIQQLEKIGFMWSATD
ncbi:unnamed protein product [Cylindrotheca closterium]|uniref:Helicase-associated domain-containing protein n=1 Tax=Cylindrotheca closterium TaxID=2856 RepID=A0AAD2G7A7_9STRA|nr:unnamed protein product [Cylindrotheca closterium]